MNALHQACARAIADARGSNQDAACDAAAAAVVGVCLAEAQRAVEALRAKYHDMGPDERPDTMAALGEALAVLAALAEDEDA